MAKTEKYPDKPSDDATVLVKTVWAAKQLGADKAKTGEILALLAEAKVPHSESSVKQTVGKARDELGYPALRGKRTEGTTDGKQSDEPTLSDLIETEALLKRLTMTAKQLADMLEALAKIGSISKLRACADYLAERD